MELFDFLENIFFYTKFSMSKKNVNKKLNEIYVYKQIKIDNLASKFTL